MTRTLRACGFLGGALIATGVSCDGGGGTEPPAAAVAVIVTPTTKTFRALADTFRMAAVARDAADATVPGKTFVWSTSDPAIATVDGAGLVTIRALGSARITATADDVEGSSTVDLDPWAMIATSSSSSQVGPSTCAIAQSGRVYCWGGPDGWSTPRLHSSAVRLTRISLGRGFGCGVSADGTGYCWGWNATGQLGDGTRADRAEPVPVTGGHKFATIAVQLPVGFVGGHACGLTLDGVAYCWGSADDGQLGVGSPEQAVGVTSCPYSIATRLCATSPLLVAGGHRFRSLSTGSHYACAISVDGERYCWGGGPGSATGNESDVPSRMDLTIRFASVASLFQHSCGVSQTGDAYCWGSDLYGQLGNNVRELDQPGFIYKVAGGLTFATIHPGAGSTCGLTTGARAYCWGDNRFGQLGQGSTSTQSDVPVAVMPAAKFVSLSAGGGYVCGVVEGGAAYCWGSNFRGTLGDGTSSDRWVPTRVLDP